MSMHEKIRVTKCEKEMQYLLDRKNIRVVTDPQEVREIKRKFGRAELAHFNGFLVNNHAGETVELYGFEDACGATFCIRKLLIQNGRVTATELDCDC